MKFKTKDLNRLIHDIIAVLPRISMDDIAQLATKYHVKTNDVIEYYVAVVQEYQSRYPNAPIDMMIFKTVEDDLTRQARKLLSTGLTIQQVHEIVHLTLNKTTILRNEVRRLLLHEHRTDPEAIESISYIFKQRSTKEIRSLAFRLTAALFGLCYLKFHSKGNRPNEYEVANALYRAHRQYQDLRLDFCDESPRFIQASRFNPFTMADAYDVASDILTQEGADHRTKVSKDVEHKMTRLATVLDTCPCCGNRFVVFLALGDKQSCPFCKVRHGLRFAAYPRSLPSAKQKKDSK